MPPTSSPMIFSRSSSVSEVNRMMSSRRLRNSGLESPLDLATHHVLDLAGHPFGSRSREAQVAAFLEETSAQVRGHDDDRVLKVDRVAETVGQLAVFEDLQQDVVNSPDAPSPISSSRMMEYGDRFTRSVSCPPSS